MMPFSSHNGYTTLSFSRLQCASLSRACWFASQESLAPDRETWHLLAALFHTCAAGPPAAAGPPVGTLIPPTLIHPELAYVAWPEDRIRLTLSTYHCASLVKGCRFAAQNSPDRAVEDWLLLSTFFEACVIAGLAQGQMSQADLAELAAGLRLLGLAEPELK